MALFHLQAARVSSKAAFSVSLAAPKSRSKSHSCGVLKNKKDASRALERTEKELNEIQEALNNGAKLEQPKSLALVVASLQRLGAELEEIACLANDSSSSSSSSSSDDEDCDKSQTAPSVATCDSQTLQVASQAPLPQTGPLAKGNTETSSTSAGPEVAMKGALNRILFGGLPAGSEHLWTDTKALLGPGLDGEISICHGKACRKAGSALVSQAFIEAREVHPGLIVETCKCLDKCKQGPNVAVSASGGIQKIFTSKEEPFKQQKEKKKLTSSVA